MGNIHFLTKQDILHIAAGEVIGRPADVLKELLENSIDAEATQIDINLVSGGIEQISVTDNGVGMDKADLEKAILPHATSKISSHEQLINIMSYGFRGEALASIATANEITITTRQATDKHGYQLHKLPQHQPTIEPVATPVGTRIVAKNIFSHQPARRKFLRKAPTELRHCLTVITNLAMITPEIDWRIHISNKLKYHWPQIDWQTRITELGSIPDLHDTFQLNITDEKTSITGIIAKPHVVTKKSDQHQFLFVNKRPVKNNNIFAEIKNTYGNLLAPKHQPLAVLHIELPPDQVDINAHPRKNRARFTDESYITNLVATELRNRLAYQQNPPKQIVFKDSARTTDKMLHSVLKLSHQQLTALSESDTHISQFARTYLSLTGPNGIIIIDQHAAHERVMFERFKKMLQAHQPQAYTLPKTALVQLTAVEMDILQQHQETFEKIGFVIQPLEQNTISVSAVPDILQDHTPNELIRHVLADLETGEKIPDLTTLVEHTLAFLACRSAIKAGDFLTQEQRHQLLKELLETPNNTNCPHGRPTIITLSENELAKRFQRR